MSRPLLLDAFCGEGGAGVGYARAGFTVHGVDNAPARLRRYPFDHHEGDAIEYVTIAMNKDKVAPAATFRYFCGICWRMLDEQREVAKALLESEAPADGA